ncbi:MAG: preprotein translocase subunit SecE [Deltaproteobacteria bacterium]|nr:preprotein translocase subunit SecE [Deltaproteobacteria bacterium]
MKKNNRKPKSRKSPPKKVKNTAAVDAVSTSVQAPNKGTKPNGKPGRAVQKTAKAGKSGESGGASNLFKIVGSFLRQAKVELKKVKWPTRKELIASTVVVIVLTLLVSLYLGLVDLGLIKIIKHVIG